MSLAEVWWRAQEQVLRRTARGRLDHWGAYDAAGTDAPVIPGFKSAVAGSPAEVREAINRAAERAMSGHFEALGQRWPHFNSQAGIPPQFWTLDPVTGKAWPGTDTFCFDIQYRHAAGYGDIKYAWEFNRLQFLQPVAASYLFSGDKAALRFLEDAISSWFNHNPPYKGIGWNSGIELSLRAISLLVVSTCCGNDLSREVRHQIRLILVSHLRWMQRFPSGFSSANNHLIAERAGEFLIGLTMPELPDAGSTVSKAQAILEREADKQILDDGVGAEQSPTYGAFTAEFLLLCAQAARNADRPMNSNVDAALLRFARFISWLALEDGTVPLIGDDDEGRVLSLAVEEPRYAASVATAIYGFNGIAPESSNLTDPSLRDAIFNSSSKSAPPPSGVRIFQTGGYSVFRGEIANQQAALVFDHGPLGYLSIAAHGHADALAWQLFLEGRAVLVDPGTYLYHSGGHWRDWFRGTAAHNTLRLGGRDQSTISGAFNWSHKANAQLTNAADSIPSFTATHDGYRKQFGLLHERTVTVLSNSIEVTDKLVGDARPPKVELSYQLAADLVAEVEGSVVRVSRDSRLVLEIRFPAGGLIMVACGQAPEDGGGWISERFGSKTPAQRVEWSSTDFPPQAVTTFLIK